MRCDEVGCNIFRIDSGLCTFGFMAPVPDDVPEDSEIEVYIKSSIYHTSFNCKVYKLCLCADGKLLSEVGCFHDLSGSNWHNSEDMTIDWCLNHCKSKGMKFYIIDAGRICFCSNTMPPFSNIVPNSQCDYPCNGENGTEGKCGGNYRMNVHAVTF